MKLKLLLVLTAGAAFAQKANWANVKNLTVGEEIRISLGDGKSIRGQLQNVTDDSIVILAANTQQSLPRAQLLKVATKRASHRARNTLIGLGVGAAVGVGIGAGADHSCAASGCLISNNFGKEVFTPLGALVGIIIGVAWPTGGWHQIYSSK